MNDITELRTHLFETLKGLRDKENPMDIERAKAVVDVAQVIINSAKVEVDHLKITGGNSAFLMGGEKVPLLAPGQTKTTKSSGGGTTSVTALPNGTTVTRHTMNG